MAARNVVPMPTLPLYDASTKRRIGNDPAFCV